MGVRGRPSKTQADLALSHCSQGRCGRGCWGPIVSACVAACQHPTGHRGSFIITLPREWRPTGRRTQGTIQRARKIDAASPVAV